MEILKYLKTFFCHFHKTLLKFYWTVRSPYRMLFQYFYVDSKNFLKWFLCTGNVYHVIQQHHACHEFNSESNLFLQTNCRKKLHRSPLFRNLCFKSFVVNIYWKFKIYSKKNIIYCHSIAILLFGDKNNLYVYIVQEHSKHKNYKKTNLI